MPALPPAANAVIARRWAASNLAARLLAEPWTLGDIGAAITAVLGPINPRTRAALAVRLLALAEETYPPAPEALTSYLIRSPFFRPVAGRPVAASLDPPRFAPLPPLAGLPIPPLATLGEPASSLGISAEQLDWLADHRCTHNRAAETGLQHYRYLLIPKRDGAKRLVEAPKPRLKAIQRRILDEVLARVPVHDATRGFVAGRSCSHPTGAR